MSSPSKHLTPEHTPSSPISKAPKEKIDESIAAAGQQASQEANNLNRELRSPLPSYLTYSFPPPKADPTGAYSYAYNKVFPDDNQHDDRDRTEKPATAKNASSPALGVDEPLPGPVATNRRPLPRKSRKGTQLSGKEAADPFRTLNSYIPYPNDWRDDYNDQPRVRPTSGQDNGSYFNINREPSLPLMTDQAFGANLEALSETGGGLLARFQSAASGLGRRSPFTERNSSSDTGHQPEASDHGVFEYGVTEGMDEGTGEPSQGSRKSHDGYVVARLPGRTYATGEDDTEDDEAHSRLFIAPKRARVTPRSRGLGGGRVMQEPGPAKPISLRQGKKPFTSDDYNRKALPASVTPVRRSAASLFRNKRLRQLDEDEDEDEQEATLAPAHRPVPFNNIGRSLRESRYAGAANEWNINQDPPMVPQEEVTDAALLKRGLTRGNGPNICKRGYGANDPENIAIVNMRESEGMNFDQIKDEMNRRRIEAGRDPILTTTGVTGRYNRTAPLLFAAQGEVFVPLSKRGGKNRPNPSGENKMAWDDALDVELVSCVKEIEAKKWDEVAKLFNEKTGKTINFLQAAQRHGML